MIELDRYLKELGQIQVYASGEFLFHAQDLAQGLYYVRSGEIRVYKMDEQGKEIEIVRLGGGDFLGEAILFVSDVFPAYAQAVKDSEVVFLAKTRLFSRLDQDPALARFFMELLARKCVVLNRRIEVLGLQTVRQRLIQYLLTRCQGQQECTVSLKMKKGELAKLLGTISETLSRNLKQLQDQGLLQVEGNTLHIKDSSRLRRELSL
jgi:CRP/FNR family transcriptional regulator